MTFKLLYRKHELHALSILYKIINSAQNTKCVKCSILNLYTIIENLMWDFDIQCFKTLSQVVCLLFH